MKLEKLLVGLGGERAVTKINEKSIRSYSGSMLLHTIYRMNLTSHSLAAAMKYRHEFILKIITGEKRINNILAGRIGLITGFGTKFWLDVQTAADILRMWNVSMDKLHTVDMSLYNYFKESCYPALIKIDAQIAKPIHPGIVLQRDYIGVTSISEFDWSNYFGIDVWRLKKIMDGKSLIDLKVIFRLSKAFETQPSFWIGLQNIYYGHYLSNIVAVNFDDKPLVSESTALLKDISHYFFPDLAGNDKLDK